MPPEVQPVTPEPNPAPQPAVPPSQKEINNIVAKESRRAVEKLLRDAGITPEDNPEMQLKEYKKWLDSQKSDLEKAQCDAKTAAAERDAAIAEAEAVNRKFNAVAKGVPADRAGDYITLANTRMTDGVTFEQALDKALADFPLTPKQPPPPYAATGDASLMALGGAAKMQTDLNKHRITR